MVFKVGRSDRASRLVLLSSPGSVFVNARISRIVPGLLVLAVCATAVACERGGQRDRSADRADQSWTGTTESGRFRVSVTPEPNPIPFQQLFELRVEVTGPDAGEPAESVRLDQVRARMPAHDHGMKTSPEIEREGAGDFRVRGMKFHMRGDGEDGRWVFELILRSDSAVDRAEFDVQCCAT